MSLKWFLNSKYKLRNLQLVQFYSNGSIMCITKLHVFSYLMSYLYSFYATLFLLVHNRRMFCCKTSSTKFTNKCFFACVCWKVCIQIRRFSKCHIVNITTTLLDVYITVKTFAVWKNRSSRHSWHLKYFPFNWLDLRLRFLLKIYISFDVL